MAHPDINIIVRCTSLFTPLAGIGRSSRRQPAPSMGVTQGEAIVPARRAGVYAHWRRSSDGALTMDWSAE
jgi:hypothetical protein